VYISTIPPRGGRVFARLKQEGFTMNNEDVLKRLRIIEGHLKGVIRMVEEDAYCIDVIRQVQAVEAALNKVSAQILDGHLNSCVITAIQGDDLAQAGVEGSVGSV